MINLKDLKDEYESLFEKEKKIDEELQVLLNSQSIYESKFSSLNSVFQNTQLIFNDAKQLSNMIDFTADLADNASSKVRQLDIAKSRVLNCVKRVTDILDLKACTDGVTKALDEEDYETAANHIHRYLNLDKDSLRLKNVANDQSDNNYLEQSFQLLQEAMKKLQSIVNDQYNQALANNDVPEIERFFKIFPLIDQRENGLEKFSDYLKAQITETANANFKQMLSMDRSDKRWNIMFADALFLLFEKVARIIEAYQPVVETYYGSGNMFSFIRNLQKECDVQSIKIFNKFKEVRKLNTIFKQVQQSIINNYGSSHISSGSNKLEEKLDPRDLDELLTEITLISARCELYKNFLLRSILNDLSSNKKNPSEPFAISNEKRSEVDAFINNLTLRSNILELIGQYSIIENYFMIENINKAIQMDDISKDSLTSSVVDDVFFIIKKCVKRSLCSDNVDGCCAMFNNCSAALDSVYKEYFHSKLKLGYQAVFDLSQAYTAIQRRFQNPDQTERDKYHFLISLNNIEVSIDCIIKLKKEFEEDVSKLFIQETQQSRDKLSSCLSELGGVSNRFKELLDFGFSQLNINDVRPQVKQLCEGYTAINHKITEDEFNSSNDQFIQNLIRSIDQILSLFKEKLSTKNLDVLHGLLATEIATQLEKYIGRCSYSKYGGLQLDKEIRLLINYLSSIISWSIREKFSRLSQISILLSLETLNELYDYWNSPLTITWRLTPNEIRQFLNLRSDFKADDIKSLKL